jgi:predicted small secreted protein
MKPLIALTFLASLSACNTFEGLGRDLAAGGEAIENVAIDARRPAPVAAPQPVYRAPPPQPVQQAPFYGTAPFEPAPQPQPNAQYVY